MGLVFYRAQTQCCWRSRADLSSPSEFDGNFPFGRNYLEMKKKKKFNEDSLQLDSNEIKIAVVSDISPSTVRQTD